MTGPLYKDEPEWWQHARDLDADGRSRQEIADEIGRGLSQIGVVLRRCNSSPISSKRKSASIVPIAAAEIRRLHALRVGRTKIAALLRVRYAQIEAALANHGVSE